DGRPRSRAASTVRPRTARCPRGPPTKKPTVTTVRSASTGRASSPWRSSIAPRVTDARTDLAEHRTRVVGHVRVRVSRRAHIALVALTRRDLDLVHRVLLVRDHREQVGDAVQPRTRLVVGLHHVPGRLRDVAVDEHLVLRAREVDPVRPREQVRLGELPTPHRILDARTEPVLLFLVRNGEPVLQQDDPVLDQEPLEDRDLPEEPAMLVRRAEAEHLLDTGAVVPAPVEQDDLAGGGQVRDVPLEVPLGAFALGRLGERRDARDARVRVLRDPLDRPALAGSVAPLEDDDDPGSRLGDPVLPLPRLFLQPAEFLLVGLLRQLAGTVL